MCSNTTAGFTTYNRRALLALTFLAFFTAVAFGQSSKVAATLEGIVKDSSGAIIPGVEVKIQNLSNNFRRVVLTDDQGFYRASEVAVGAYEVRAELPGFALYVHTGLTLTVGSTTRLDIQLVPGEIKSQVTVTDQPPAIDPTQTSVTTTIENERIEELPVRSRNYLNFVLLAPGVAASSPQKTAGKQPALGDSGFTFGGLRARSNNLSIDGVENNDEYTGSARTELSLEIVREFQVVNNGLSAESGGASGGSINVITKSGSNEIRGDAFLFAQDGSLNARSPFSNNPRKPDLKRYRAGFSIGGPLVKDRTFYYSAFEQEHLRGETSSDIDPSTLSAINRFLSSGAFPRLSARHLTDAFFPIAQAETEISGKLDHQPNDRHSLMLRYAFTNNRVTGNAFGGGLTDASARGSSFTEDYGLVGSITSIVGARDVNDLRFQAATRRAAHRANEEIGSEIDVAGLAIFGRPYDGLGRRRENHYQIWDTFVFSRGAHLWKVGAASNHVRLRLSAPDGFGGFYNFGSLEDFVDGRADSFRQAFGVPDTSASVTSWGVFVQDHWSASRRLQLDAGLRYDLEHLPREFNQDANNFSPRIGIAFSPSSRYVLRAGYGIFYDRYVLAFLSRALLQGGQQAFEQVADRELATAIFRQAQGGPLLSHSDRIQPSVFRPDPLLATSYSQQANLSAEVLLSKDIIAGVSYLFVRGTKLSRTRNVNLLAPVLLTAGNAAGLGSPEPKPQELGRDVFTAGRRDVRFNDIYQLEDSAASSYHGLSLTLNRRFRDELAFSAGYTLSKTLDDASDFDEQPESPLNLRAERALSRNHQGQRFVFSALIETPFAEEEESGKPSRAQSKASEYLGEILGHIEIAPIVTVTSGRPVTPLTGLDSNRSHAFPFSSRPLGMGRSSLKLPANATVDLRALKFLPFGEHRRLDFVVEFFNLFNHVNVSQMNPFFGAGRVPIIGFAHPIGALNSRQIQFSIDFEF